MPFGVQSTAAVVGAAGIGTAMEVKSGVGRQQSSVVAVKLRERIAELQIANEELRRDNAQLLAAKSHAEELALRSAVEQVSGTPMCCRFGPNE